MERITLITKPSAEYELLDAGDESKLERFGDVLLERPDPQALWQKNSPELWGTVQGRYVREGKEGKWTGALPTQWQIELDGLKLLVKPTSFKHTGIFPEHVPGWQWVREVSNGKNPKVLNLFGYTGGYTLAVAQAGAEVTHVDASKTAVAWAKENAEASGLADAPIRWMVEDVLVFVKREIKRGSKYDGIIMDPPAFGHGPKNELWKIEESFVELVQLCKELLSDKPLLFLINGYAEGYSPLAFAYNLESIKQKYGGEVEYGDLAIQQSNSERTLPAGIFARWKA